MPPVKCPNDGSVRIASLYIYWKDAAVTPLLRRDIPAKAGSERRKQWERALYACGLMFNILRSADWTSAPSNAGCSTQDAEGASSTIFQSILRNCSSGPIHILKA
eukprot:scaffold7059_cov250-Pinguiococcus_pyrenoidosus.AAC.10